MSKLFARITIHPEQCGGQPCVRGMRVRVIDVLGLLAGGLSMEEVLEEMPDLEREILVGVCRGNLGVVFHQGLLRRSYANPLRVPRPRTN